jgi:hypothetical protein
MKREEKRMERVDGKAVGDYGFITFQRTGLADGARADAIPNAAGGESGHGAAKPDGVITGTMLTSSVQDTELPPLQGVPVVVTHTFPARPIRPFKCEEVL